jgi:hypothetical protein
MIRFEAGECFDGSSYVSSRNARNRHYGYCVIYLTDGLASSIEWNWPKHPSEHGEHVGWGLGYKCGADEPPSEDFDELNQFIAAFDAFAESEALRAHLDIPIDGTSKPLKSRRL